MESPVPVFPIRDTNLEDRNVVPLSTCSLSNVHLYQPIVKYFQIFPAILFFYLIKQFVIMWIYNNFAVRRFSLSVHFEPNYDIEKPWIGGSIVFDKSKQLSR